MSDAVPGTSPKLRVVTATPGVVEKVQSVPVVTADGGYTDLVVTVPAGSQDVGVFFGGDSECGATFTLFVQSIQGS